jgi:4a-hydroxytetrahydrobiopterin dehydratase
MTDRINSQQFHESDGVEDWRVLYGRAHACFRTGSFAAGVALVDEIGVLADAANHHPDIDLRYASLTVRLVSHDVDGLSDRDVALARQISEAARELGAVADPSAVQHVDLAIDVLVCADVMPFWRAVLGYEQASEDDLVDPQGRGPSIWFQQLDVARTERNCIHLDIAVPHELAEARVAAALAAGGRLVNDEHAPSWWVLADAEGNEACVATWVGRWWEE